MSDASLTDKSSNVMDKSQAISDNDTAEKVKQIKQNFHLFMNGQAARSMRDKGLNYNVNWGIALPRLREIAADYGKDYDLAVALWAQSVRECKIMATMIMPTDKMTEVQAEAWMDAADTTEIVEMCAFNIFGHLSFAFRLSQKWLTASDSKRRLCAYHIMGRLLQGGDEVDENTSKALLQQIDSDLQGSDMALKHAAVNCLTRFCELSDDNARLAKEALKQSGADFFV